MEPSTTTTTTKLSMLQQVTNELNEQKRKQVKSDLKQLLEDREKAASALESIDQKIIEKLVSVGEDEQAVRELLK